MNSIDALNSVKDDDLSVVSTEIGRTKRSCYHHWKEQILPILKTNILGLPQGIDWMKDFLKYMEKNRIIAKKDIPYNKLVNEMCPGQTTRSLAVFANSIPRKWDGKKMIRSNEPFHEICLRWLNEPSPNSYLGNEKMANARLEYAEEIVKIYQSLNPNKKYFFLEQFIYDLHKLIVIFVNKICNCTLMLLKCVINCLRIKK